MNVILIKLYPIGVILFLSFIVAFFCFCFYAGQISILGFLMEFLY